MLISGSAIFLRSPKQLSLQTPSFHYRLYSVCHQASSFHLSACFFSTSGAANMEQTHHSSFLKYFGALLASHSCLWELVLVNLFHKPLVYVCPSQSSISIAPPFSLFKGLKWLSSAHNCQQSLQDFKTFHLQDKTLALKRLRQTDSEWGVVDGSDRWNL